MLSFVLMFAERGLAVEQYESQSNMTLWQSVDALVQQVPFTQTKVENALITQLAEKDTSRNPIRNTAFQFYIGGPVRLSGGVRISKVDLRIRHKPGHPGFLMLNLEGACIDLSEVRAHYSELKVTERPRGKSLEEVTSYTAELRWGELSFSFKERNPNCVWSLAFEPALVE
jgi:hypothetical protein